MCVLDHLKLSHGCGKFFLWKWSQFKKLRDHSSKGTVQKHKGFSEKKFDIYENRLRGGVFCEIDIFTGKQNAGLLLQIKRFWLALPDVNGFQPPVTPKFVEETPPAVHDLAACYSVLSSLAWPCLTSLAPEAGPTRPYFKFFLCFFHLDSLRSIFPITATTYLLVTSRYLVSKRPPETTGFKSSHSPHILTPPQTPTSLLKLWSFL